MVSSQFAGRKKKEREIEHLCSTRFNFSRFSLFWLILAIVRNTCPIEKAIHKLTLNWRDNRRTHTHTSTLTVIMSLSVSQLNCTTQKSINFSIHFIHSLWMTNQRTIEPVQVRWKIQSCNRNVPIPGVCSPCAFNRQLISTIDPKCIWDFVSFIRFHAHDRIRSTLGLTTIGNVHLTQNVNFIMNLYLRCDEIISIIIIICYIITIEQSECENRIIVEIIK